MTSFVFSALGGLYMMRRPRRKSYHVGYIAMEVFRPGEKIGSIYEGNDISNLCLSPFKERKQNETKQSKAKKLKKQIHDE